MRDKKQRIYFTRTKIKQVPFIGTKNIFKTLFYILSWLFWKFEKYYFANNISLCTPTWRCQFKYLSWQFCAMSFWLFIYALALFYYFKYFLIIIFFIFQVHFADTFKFFLSLYGHKLPVLCMDISSDGDLIVTGSADKNIKIWGLDFGDCHKSIFAHADRYIICFSW